MILQEGETRKFIQDLIDSKRSEFAGRCVSKLEIIKRVEVGINDWSYDVLGAVQRDVAFRLPHELEGSANCGERAALLYGVARELKLENPRFISYKTDNEKRVYHACVLFGYGGRTYIAGTSDWITSNFELRPRGIRVGKKLVKHHGLIYLDDASLDSLIQGLRKSEGSVLKLFCPGQFLVTKKTDSGAREIFVTFNDRRGVVCLPEYKNREPNLEVTLLQSEPYNENTGVVLVYPALDPNSKPRFVAFFDLEEFCWGDIKGTYLGSVDKNHGGRLFVRDSNIGDESLLGILAFLKYRSAIDGKIRRSGRGFSYTYLESKDERDIITRLKKEVRALKRKGNFDEAKAKEESIRRLVENVASNGDEYYERYCDFRVSTLWPMEARKDEILSYRRRRRFRDVRRYLDIKHIDRMEFIQFIHGDEIKIVREKVASALGN